MPGSVHTCKCHCCVAFLQGTAWTPHIGGTSGSTAQSHADSKLPAVPPSPGCTSALLPRSAHSSFPASSKAAMIRPMVPAPLLPSKQEYGSWFWGPPYPPSIVLNVPEPGCGGVGMELAGEIAVLPTGLVEVWCGDTRQVCRKAQLEMMGPDLAPSPHPHPTPSPAAGL